MLSYRHAFHAGNHADVLKHSILSILLQHFRQKERAFTYIDTCSYIQENGNRYAGSPEIARQMSREQGNLILAELHTSEIDLLRDTMRFDPRVHIHERNGFELLRALLLPPRTCVLIDPSYEIDSGDYTNVIDAVQKAYRRCSSATFAVWYPLVNRRDFDTMQLIQSLCALTHDPEKGMQAQLYIDDDGTSATYGLRRSGMIVINAPWKCRDYTRDALAWICTALRPQRFVWHIL